MRVIGRRPRVAIGPLEAAGCCAALAEGLRAVGAEAEVVVVHAHPFGYPADRVLGKPGRVRYGISAPLRNDVLHLQFALTWLPGSIDAWWARALGRTVVMTLHGDEARLSGLAEALFSTPAGDPASDGAVRRRLRRVARFCHAAIVKDLELAAYAYSAFERVYVSPSPLLGVRSVQPQRPRAGSGPPVVLHAPSDPARKSTTIVEAVVHEVAERTPLEFRLVTGVSHARLGEELRQADVVVDQLDAAATGVLALEAMQLGLPVLAEYDPRVLPPFQDRLPIVRVTPASLAVELEALLADADRRLELGRLGREYVERVHAPARVGAAARAVYEHARRSPPGIYEATADGVRPLTRRRDAAAPRAAAREEPELTGRLA